MSLHDALTIFDRTIVLAKPCNGSADLAKAVPNELAARTIAVTIRRAIIGILPSLLEAVADRLRNALNHVGRASRLSPIFPEKFPMSIPLNFQSFPPFYFLFSSFFSFLFPFFSLSFPPSPPFLLFSFSFFLFLFFFFLFLFFLLFFFLF